MHIVSKSQFFIHSFAKVKLKKKKKSKTEFSTAKTTRRNVTTKKWIFSKSLNPGALIKRPSNKHENKKKKT